MALRDISNVPPQKPYECRLLLDPKYAPLIKKGLPVGVGFKKTDFSAKRCEGATNLDLWVSGSLYPVDPRTGQRPPFTNLKELLSYVCEGMNGLLGYTMSLHKYDAARPLQLKVENLEQQQTLLKERIVQLQTENGDLTEKARYLEAMEEELAQTLQAHEDELAVKNNLLQLAEVKLKELQVLHRKNIRQAQRVARQWKAKYEKRVNNTNNPGAWLRKRKDISELSQSGGYAKRRKRQLRCHWQPSTSTQRMEENARLGKRRRLCGDSFAQLQSATIIASLLTVTEKKTLLKHPSMNNALIEATNSIFKKVGDNVNEQGILAACDSVGVSQRGYAEIRKTVRNGFRLTHKNLKLSILPNAHKVTKLRRELNENLPNFIGDYYYLDNVLPNAHDGKKKPRRDDAAPPRIITLGPNNSIFADIEAVQRSMVKFYNVTLQELEGGPLIFVLKLDEAEIVKNQKLERVSITLMNRALDPSIDKNDERYFSVQSEKEIWPVACFQVSKESHAQLKFIFDKTAFPTTIKAQEEGKLLDVPSMGKYKVEWHMAADMKTIKCMYGLKHGANAKHSCIYCLQEKVKRQILENEAAAHRVSKKRQQPSWKGGLFCSSAVSKPTRGTSYDEAFDPILPIPLLRVHICTLHANVRIVEKILHMHFIYVWNMQNKKLQKQSIEDMENSLSAAGVHGGQVQIFEDIKLSGSTGSVPKKLSMNGAHAARLFNVSPLSGRDKVWKDVCEADHQNGADGKLSRMRMWKAYEDLQPYLTGLTLSDDERRNFKQKVEKWGHLFIDAFGEDHVTHYVHVLVRHASWFVDTYGSLAVWSCQGMEKSHAAAKREYHRHTQLGGTRLKKSPLVQVWQHWYRNIQHRMEAAKRFNPSVPSSS